MNEPAAPQGDFREEEILRHLEAYEAEESAYLEEAFGWLLDHVARYFPSDELIAEDAGSHVHFLHSVVEEGKPVGLLVYRLRKNPDKAGDYVALREDLCRETGVPDCLVVDTETSAFPPPASLEGEEVFVEIPPEALRDRIGALREELKRRAKIRSLRESL